MEPFVKRLKSLVKTLMVRFFQAVDDYQRLNQTNADLYRSNERLKGHNKQLTADNNRLKEEIKDYKLLRKVFGNRQIDSLLEQAMAKTIFEEIGGTYTQQGDYLLPDLELPEEETKPIGVWG